MINIFLIHIFIEDHGFVIGLHKHQMKKSKLLNLAKLMMNIDKIK